MSDSPRRRLPADERRQEIVEWAFRLLAEKGFEGLRMRDIALHVGVNSATLHHYFPTKQDLIEAVAQHLAGMFATHRAPPLAVDDAVPRVIYDLRQEFADAAFYRAAHPELLRVSRELSLRAQRDSEVAAVIAPLNARWCEAVEDVLTRGQRAKVFRVDVDPVSMSRAVVAALWGMGALLQLSVEEFAAACAALERSLLTSPAALRSASRARHP